MCDLVPCGCRAKCPAEQEKEVWGWGWGHWCGQRKLLCVPEMSDRSEAVHGRGRKPDQAVDRKWPSFLNTVNSASASPGRRRQQLPLEKTKRDSWPSQCPHLQLSDL